MKEVSKFFTVDISFAIVGILSGLLAMNSEENRKKTKWQRFIIGLTGFCSAVLLTPLIVWVLETFFAIEVPHPAQLGIAYTVGQIGLEGTKRVMNLIIKLRQEKEDK